MTQSILEQITEDYGYRALDVGRLPPFCLKNRKNPVPQITRYLRRLMQEHTSSSQNCLLLPSMATLARYFNVLPEEVKEAMKILHRRGYCQIRGGLYGNTVPWHMQEDDTSVHILLCPAGLP